MASSWSLAEVEATVADYFLMLEAQFKGIPYSKTEHRRRLLPLLSGRSEQSIEFKYANISAILINMGFPYIVGYKPRANYQGLLYKVVAERLSSNKQLIKLAEVDAESSIDVPTVDDILATLTSPPTRATASGRVAEPVATYAQPTVNYLEREARNRSLGSAGEEFVMNYERARLIANRCEALAAKIEHVSKSRGDAEGFDILSFETNGAERIIEVKTTKYGKDTPFFVSRNELKLSESYAQHYQLYRLFEFRVAPRLFTLPGALTATCRLEPTTYMASVM